MMQTTRSIEIRLNFINNDDYTIDIPKLLEEFSKMPQLKKLEVSNDENIPPALTISSDDFFVVLSNEIRVDTKMEISAIAKLLNKFADICATNKEKSIPLSGYLAINTQFPYNKEVLENNFHLKNQIDKVDGVDESELNGFSFRIKEKSGERYTWFFNRGIKTSRLLVRMFTKINIQYSNSTFNGFEELQETANKCTKITDKWLSLLGSSQ